MQDRDQLKNYCRNGRWDDADTWLCKELVFVHSRVIRRRICTFSYSILLTLVLMGITWGGIFPACNGVEITKFPFAKAADAFLVWMRQMIPIEGGGGNAVAILGLLVLPFVVWGLLSLFTCFIKSKKYAKKKRAVNDSDTVKRKIGLLDKMYDKHNHGHVGILCVFWVLSAVGGWIMAMCAHTSPENFGRYLFVGLICAALYAAGFWCGIAVVSRIYEAREMPIFNPYNYYDYILMAKGEYVYHGSDDDTPPSTGFVLDDETIQTILDDVYDSLGGGGYGNY